MVINVTDSLIAKGLLRIADAVSFIVTSGGADLIDQRTTAWTNNIYHEFTVTWGSAAERTEFFNTGGQIRISGDRLGGSTSNQNDSRTVMLNKMGTIIFDHEKTFISGTTGSAFGTGNSGVTGSYVAIYQAMSQSFYYASDQYTLEVKSLTANQLTFKISQQDASDGVFDAPTDGTITSYVDTRRHKDTLPAPILSTTLSMTAGS